jgi:hypothetical protein
LLPTITLPKLRLVGFDARAPGATPVPVIGTVRFASEAFEEIVNVPLVLPAAVGVKVTRKVALCPAVSVVGVVIPLTVNPLPLTPTCEIVTLVPPVLVTVSDRD